MERSSTYSYTPTSARAGIAGGVPHMLAQAIAIDPPTSKKVLERLADYLTPPHSLLQPSRAPVRSLGHDDLAAKCSRTARKPDASIHWAYDACTEMIRRHSRSFYFSTRLLPRAKHDGIMALYAFCRLSDDLVDSMDMGDNPAIARVKALLALNSWARANAAPTTRVDHPVVVAWADARTRFGIPQALADELIEGLRMDLTTNPYQTWDDLWLYCYRVASTVGLMSMYVTGAETMQAVPHAVQMGVALQLTNILRDVGEDARAGRIYLPGEDMAHFGYTRDMLMAGELNDRFIGLMKFEIQRARALYRAAWPGIALLPADSRLAVAAAGALYRGILDKIEEANYDVFTRRAYVTTGEKLRMLPRLWINVRILERSLACLSTFQHSDVPTPNGDAA